MDNYLIRASTLAWIREYKIVNEKGDRVLVGRQSPHFFMGRIYADESKKICVRKPSQIGVSLWAILNDIHHTRYWGINQIHTLPTAGDVTKFVPAKVNELIKRNPAIRKGMSDKEVDAVAQKQFGKGFLYFKGTFSEREALMISSDRNTYDEFDKSNMTEIGNYASRQEGEKSLKMEAWISTPTVPGYGIDQKFEESDQKHWRFNCESCKFRQHMQWPENVDIDRGIYICSKCGKEITEKAIRSGDWEARFPGRELSGYWITQMIVPWIKKEDLIDEYLKLEREGRLDYFFNHKLGLPYVSSESQIPASLIYQNISNLPHTETNCIMGVDVQGRELYVTLGTMEGVFSVFSLGDTSDKDKWKRLEDVMNVYEVRLAVIDGGFMTNDVFAFAKKFPYKVYVNFYKDDPKKAKIIRFPDEDFKKKDMTFEEEITILTERDRMIDMFLARLKNGGIKYFLPKEHNAIKLLVAHTGTTYSRTVTNKVGIESREWVHTGPDDAFHSNLYYEIAREKLRTL